MIFILFQTSFLVVHERAFTYVSVGMSIAMALGAVGLVVMHHVGFMMVGSSVQN